MLVLSDISTKYSFIGDGTCDSIIHIRIDFVSVYVMFDAY